MRVILEDHINGSFDGFEGNRIYQLTNGQTWVQIDTKCQPQYHYMPKVSISEDEGSFFMEVEGLNDSVRVQRIY